MDGWNAPQWADFDASVMSDIDEYFNIVHEELESGKSGDLQYHSCPSTPNSNKSTTNSPYKTPKGNSNGTNEELASYMKNLQINSAKKTSKGKSSMTPRALLMKKACMKLTHSSTPLANKNTNVAITPVEEKTDESSNEKVTRITENSTENILVNHESADNEDCENADQNTTLVATSEKDEEPVSEADPVVLGENSAEPRIETDKQLEKLVAEPVIESKIPTLDNHNDAKLTAVVTTKNKTEVSLPSTTVVKAGAAAVTKVPNRLDISNRIAPDKKTYRSKPTVLTSHARRQSTSKYRRVSNKYVSLAEAVSKFQNGTPERFRSSNNKASKGTNVGGPLEKVKRTVMKLTCATSPLLRCKFRARGVNIPTSEEREIIKMEEGRKNRIKPNPIKQSIMNPPKKLKMVTETLPAPNVKKVTSNEPLKKVTTAQPKPVKKVDEPSTIFSSKTSAARTTMNPPKPMDKMVKSISGPIGPPSSLRRTLMNPPQSTHKTNERATISNIPSSSRRTMLTRPKPLMKIDPKPTPISQPWKPVTKTRMNPPESFKKIETEAKALVESFMTLDKKKDTSILTTTVLSDSTRKTPCKKTVPTVVSTDEGVSIKDVEILHFGIPVGNDYKKITKTVPFSFETRHKELQNKREKLKNQQIEDETKKTKKFHARPVPAYIIKPTATCPKNSKKSPVVADVPFSFQQRNEITLKKKKEMFDQMVEREKQARVFHAKPAPNFKPVFVRGASAENLRTKNSIEKESKDSNKTRPRALSHSSMVENRENTAPNIVTNNPQFPKLKNPLMTQHRKIKKTAL